MNSKALIVDDETEICLLLAAILRNQGYETYTAHSLSEAKNLLSNIDFKVVFLDLNLPDGIGFQLVPVLKQKFPDIRIVIISAYDSQLEKQKAEQEGADYFISKPFGRNNVMEAFSQMGINAPSSTNDNLVH